MNDETTRRFPRTLVEAFGPYAGRGPIYGPDDDVNTPYQLGDLCVMLAAVLGLVAVVLVL